MRIAFYAPLKSPNHPVPSGDRRVARLLMDALLLAGHQVDLVSEFRSFEGRGDPAAQAALRSQGEGIAADLLARWSHDGPAVPRPDLWLTYHLYYKAPDWLGPAVSRALGLPYVVAEASFAAKRAKGPWAIGHAAVEDALQLADLLLCPTADDMPALRSVAQGSAQLWRLPPFLDPEPYLEAARLRQHHRAQLADAPGLDTAVPWIIVSAMMRPGDKQASYQALAQVLRQLVDLPWRLLVAGDGPAGGQIRAALEQAAPGRCHFAGECSAGRLAALFAASDLCLWPAVNEAYGMAMLEAQAAGTPVVSCAVRGVPEVVRDGLTGLLAPPGDFTALAACARRLLQDAPLRAQMGHAAARFVVGERSTAQAARLLQEALATLPRLSGRAGPCRAAA
jgi:glycosyltransferase involved in cell wall biosynthesis